MTRFITHPAFTNMLEQSWVKIKYLSSLVDIRIISSFLLQYLNSIHIGLLQVVKYGLACPAHHIFQLSFHSKQELCLCDTLGILSLQGTAFIRLPFTPEQLYSTIEDTLKTNLLFQINIGKHFPLQPVKHCLKKISILEH